MFLFIACIFAHAVGPQTPITGDRTTWRDAWLEQAIEEALSVPPPPVKKRHARKVARYQPRDVTHAEMIESISTIFDGVDVACHESSGTLTEWHNNENATGVIMIKDGGSNMTEQEKADADERAMAEFRKVMLAEFKRGGICIESATMKLMVTPTCRRYPSIASEFDQQSHAAMAHFTQ